MQKLAIIGRGKMLLTTHLTFSTLIYLLSIAFFSQDFSLAKLLIINLGSLLPDIDTRFSFVGHLFSPISKFIESRFGHRTITHSLIFIIVLYILLLPLKFFNLGQYTTFFLFGVLSHILLDSMNKQGVLLFYPSNIMAVLPNKEDLRIAVNSEAEKTLLVIFLILLLLSIPFAQIGFFRSLHLLMKDYDSAVLDYKKFSVEGYGTFAEIDGYEQITKQPIKNHFKIVELVNNDLLIKKNNSLFLVNNKNNSDISINKIKVIRDKKIKIILQKVIVKNVWLNEILKLESKNNQFLIGDLETDQNINIFLNDVIKFNSVKIQNKNINLNYASFNDLKNLGNLFIINGFFYIKNEFLADNNFNQIENQISIQNEIKAISSEERKEEKKKTKDIKIEVNSFNEIKVKINQTIKQGQLLAIVKNDKQKEKQFFDDKLEKIKEEKKNIITKKINLTKEIKFFNEKIKFYEKKYNYLEILNTKNDIRTAQDEIENLNTSFLDMEKQEQKTRQDINKLNYENKIYSFVNGKIENMEVNQNNNEINVVLKISD